MITEQNLIDLGFTNKLSPYTGKGVWTLGKMQATDVSGYPTTIDVVYYDLETQYCKTIAGEFTVLGRKCETDDEIIKFVECINFLLELQVDVGYSDDYKNYVKQSEFSSNPKWLKIVPLYNGYNGADLYTQEEFIEKIKTDDEFAKKWKIVKE